MRRLEAEDLVPDASDWRFAPILGQNSIVAVIVTRKGQEQRLTTEAAAEKHHDEDIVT